MVKFRRVLTVAAAGTATLLALTLGAAPANAATSGDPQTTGCANTASTIWSHTYLGYGTVEVRYSSACGTNWVRVTGAGGQQSEAGIWSAASGWQYSLSYSSAPSQYWTPMVYAPGANCVVFYAKINTLNTGNLQLC
jgi:hypothetical protein